MKRALVVIAVLLLFGLGLWLRPDFLRRVHGESRASIIARPYAKQLGLEIKNDPRFANVEVGVWEFGSKGPLFVRGRVHSDSDAAELRRKVDVLKCPVGVSFQVIATNSSP